MWKYSEFKTALEAELLKVKQWVGLWDLIWWNIFSKAGVLLLSTMWDYMAVFEKHTCLAEGLTLNKCNPQGDAFGVDNHEVIPSEKWERSL